MNIYSDLDKLYEDWTFCIGELEKSPDSKIIFFVDGILGLTTYDNSLSKKLGRKILSIIKDIYNKKVFDKINDPEYIYEYTIYFNFIINWLEWGTSIRHAWFDGELEPDYPLINIGYLDEKWKVNDSFIEELIRWLED